MPKWSPKMFHLSYANDTFLFCSWKPSSVRKMMNVLRNNEHLSGEMINLDKSLVYLCENVPIGVIYQLRRIDGIIMGFLPFTYLGYPKIWGRKNKSHFEVLIKKVAKMMHSWQNILLSFRGKHIYSTCVINYESSKECLSWIV